MSDLLAWYPRCATCAFGGDSHGETFALRCWRAEMRDGKQVDPSTRAVSMDAEDYGARLLVSPDFGCVMHSSLSEQVGGPTEVERGQFAHLTEKFRVGER